MPKPVLLCHGAYTGAWEWSEVVSQLRQRGIDAVALDLTTRERGGSLAKDEQLVRETLARWDEPAVLVGHSYSGAVITGASTVNPHVAHLIYVAAALPQAGESVSASRGAPPTKTTSIIESQPTIPDRPATAARLFNDATTAQAEWATPQLGGFVRSAFDEVPSGLGWREHPSTYVLCTLDLSIPLEIQEGYAAHTSSAVRIEAGHSPMITQPELIAEVIANVTGA